MQVNPVASRSRSSFSLKIIPQKPAKLKVIKLGGWFQDMVREKKKEEPIPVDNVISDQTGQFDLRFILWRHFCEQNNIPVETLPSQLDGEQKERWEELKNSRLRTPGQK
ncbi:MAG: hypothetical protein LC770_03310 [Acidobacteria bacterium]|nr:hypothetical protein [Acidobacteriota bacterium]MCA1603608.1 hypothetical protein [Acidobacteriota bacterium]